MNRQQRTVRKDIIALLPRLRRFARQLSHDRSDADNVVAQACLGSLHDLDDWDTDTPLDRRIFCKIRKSCETKHHRQTLQQPTHAAQQLQNKVNSLPPDLASALLVVTVEGYSYAEAAALFEIPKHAVMDRVFQARKLLFSGQPHVT